jgi:hypothetical protein
MGLERQAALACLLLALVAAASAARAELPRIDVDKLYAKYGKPDIDRSSENERPRPPLVTRMLTYKKARVRFALLADGPVGSPPPYRAWLFIGVQDPKTDAVLSAEEVERRFAKAGH